MLNESTLVTRGRRRGMKYYLPENAPTEEDDGGAE
jgi:hypothetical protein